MKLELELDDLKLIQSLLDNIIRTCPGGSVKTSRQAVYLQDRIAIQTNVMPNE